MKLTWAEIEAAKSPRGGYSREALARLGVPCPPPSGWREKLLRGEPMGGLNVEGKPFAIELPLF
jgi:hypothetical protein